jgi:magnesium transporter
MQDEPETALSEHASDDAYALNAATVDAILAAVEVGAHDRLVALLEPLHAADIADLLEQVSRFDRRRIIELWGQAIDGDVLAELSEGVRNEILTELPQSVFAAAVQDLDSDDVVAIVEDLEEEQQGKLLEALDEPERLAVLQSLQYPEETAGRLMQRELVMAPTHWTVGDVIDFMRGKSDLPETFYDVIVVDPRLHPVGTVHLGRIMASERATPLSRLMDEDFRTIPVDQSQEDVAYAFNQYHMVSAPVVDDEGRLVGVITIDDAMEVLGDEAEEDMKLLAGIGSEEISDSFWDTARARFPWLAVNICTALISSTVISFFSGSIEAIVALAVLMPIVASMGGNAGTQTLTVAVRALATRDLTDANKWRVVLRETGIGVFNGAAFGLIVGFVGYLWFGTPMLGVVLWGAMLLNMSVAALAGILIPITLDRRGVDPALASSVFVTMSTDVIGFMAFLGLATLILL